MSFNSRKEKKNEIHILSLSVGQRAGYFVTYLSIVSVAFWKVNCFISESLSFFFLLSALRTSWIFALKQILSAKDSLWTEGEYGNTAERCPNLCTSQNTDFLGSMLCFSLIFCCKILQQRSSVSDAAWRLLCSLKFLQIFFFWKQGRSVYLGFFLASLFPVPFIFLSTGAGRCYLENTIRTSVL